MSTIRYDLERPENYDVLVPLVIPRWDVFYGTVAGYIPSHSRRVLELGSGTGILTAMIREQVRCCDIVGIDIDPEVLSIARKKPGLQGVTFMEGDIRGEWPEGPYDAVATTQCLFRFTPAERAEIACRAFRNLDVHGVFLNGDVFHPGNPWEFAFYAERWRDFMRKNGQSEEVADMMLGPLEPMIKNYTAVDFCSVLRSAGFSRVFVPYRNELYGIVLAFREGWETGGNRLKQYPEEFPVRPCIQD